MPGSDVRLSFLLSMMWLLMILNKFIARGSIAAKELIIQQTININPFIN
jgi:hypothetical protein